MHRVPLCGLLKRQRQAQRRAFIVEPACKHDRLWQTFRKTAGHANRWMAREICDQQSADGKLWHLDWLQIRAGSFQRLECLLIDRFSFRISLLIELSF